MYSFLNVPGETTFTWDVWSREHHEYLQKLRNQFIAGECSSPIFDVLSRNAEVVGRMVDLDMTWHWEDFSLRFSGNQGSSIWYHFGEKVWLGRQPTELQQVAGAAFLGILAQWLDRSIARTNAETGVTIYLARPEVPGYLAAIREVERRWGVIGKSRKAIPVLSIRGAEVMFGSEGSLLISIPRIAKGYPFGLSPDTVLAYRHWSGDQRLHTNWKLCRQCLELTCTFRSSTGIDESGRDHRLAVCEQCGARYRRLVK